MTDDNVTQIPPVGQPDPPRRRRRRSRAHRIGLWSLSSILMISMAGGLLLLIIIGQTMTAPLWLRERLSARLEQNLSGLQVSFGDIELVIPKGWRPRIRLRDLVLSQPDGQVLLRLSEVEASLSLRALLHGQVQPSSIELTGAFATLRRAHDGTVALRLGDTAAPLRRAPDMAGLLDAWGRALDSPPLRMLELIEMDALTLRFEDMRSGRAWTVDGGRIVARRLGEDFNLSSSFSLLSGRDYASVIEASYNGRIGTSTASFGFLVQDIAAQDIAAQSPVLNWLGVLRAPISGALRGSIDATGAVGPLSATLQIGPGVLQPTDRIRPIPFDGARTYFTYDPAEQRLSFDELSLVSDWVSGVGEGSARLEGVASGKLTGMVGQFTLRDLKINPSNLYARPLAIALAAADFRLTLNPFLLTLGEMRITDGDSTLALSGELDAAQAGWDLSLDGRVDRLTPKRLVQLWPPGAAAKPRDWIRRNVIAARVKNLNLALRAHPGAPVVTYLDFDFDRASVIFQKSMPPVIAASGHGMLMNDRFSVTAVSGRVDSGAQGAVDVSGTSFIIADVTIKKGAPGIVRGRASGPVAAVMALLDRPPLSVLKGTPLPVDLARGRVAATGTLKLPIRKGVKFDEMELSVDGTIRDVSSDILVPGHVLSAPELAVTVADREVTISGAVRIDDLPATATWRQPLGTGAKRASHIVGEVELSPRAVETFDLGLPPDSVSGRGKGQFRVDLAPGAPPKLTLTSDLVGVGLRIPSLTWAKPARTRGRLLARVTLDHVPRVDDLEIDAAGLSASGQITSRPGGGLDRASFSSVRIGKWLNGPVAFIGHGKGAPTLQLKGGVLDLRTANFGSGGAGGPSEIDVTLDRLQITDTLALTGFEGRFSTVGGLNGAFTGRLNGKTPVTGDMVPQGDGSAFRIRSDDAGGIFRDAGLLTKARGGDFTMTLRPTGGEGEYDGTVEVTGTRVKDAPAIAALLNAASIVGLLDELSGAGIQFTRVEARFHLAPDMLTLYSSSAVGPSIGLSMNGRYDLLNDRLDMQGTISPLYLLNGIGAVLTRKGEGLFGFNYTLGGPAADPSVKVNPLSALTPGMLRDIFRKAPPRDPNLPPRQPDSDRLDPGNPGGSDADRR